MVGPAIAAMISALFEPRFRHGTTIRKLSTLRHEPSPSCRGSPISGEDAAAFARPALLKDGAPFAIEIAINPDAKTLIFSASVVSVAFKGKSRVKHHQMVYAALKGKMGGELHALALTTAEG